MRVEYHVIGFNGVLVATGRRGQNIRPQFLQSDVLRMVLQPRTEKVQSLAGVAVHPLGFREIGDLIDLWLAGEHLRCGGPEKYNTEHAFEEVLQPLGSCVDSVFHHDGKIWSEEFCYESSLFNVP